jgi:hypothetical protein
MIGKEEFSNLRLLDFFPDNAYVRKCSKSADERSYDQEWLGGVWDMDHLPGVKFFYPEVDGSKLGAMELSLRIPETDDKASKVDWFGDPSKQEENAAKVLAVLDLPFRFRDSLGTFNDLLKKWNIVILEKLYPNPYGPKDLPWTWQAFHFGKPDEFLLHVLVHHAEGILRVEVMREDLIERNKIEC